VVDQALRAIADGEPRLLGYGVTDQRAWEVGLACGGRIELYLQPVGPADGKPGLLERLLRLRAERRPVALVTDLVMGLQTLVFPSVVHGGFGLEEPLLAAARDCLAADRSAVVEAGEDRRLFVHVFAPVPRLLVVGGVHIAQVLAPMARLAGFQVTVIDPRRGFAAAERFPGTTVVDAWPDEALVAAGLDPRSAVVTLTHDPKLDDPALGAALRAPVFHIGALGSRRSHAQRLDRLRAQGFAEAELARIHGPVGLRIGAVTPAEIAVSILAELVARRRGIGTPTAGAASAPGPVAPRLSPDLSTPLSTGLGITAVNPKTDL
jgi:xanthine dehydrogenase accessory factor